MSSFTARLRPQPATRETPLALYNMWPRNYSMHDDGAFVAMADDLDRVAAMNYNAVYVNPFFKVGRFPKRDDKKIGSLYAVSNMQEVNPLLFNGETGSFFKEEEITALGKQIKTFCKKAVEKGITPLFDLPQSHLSPDSSYIADAEAKGLEILKRHPSDSPNKGNYIIHHLDENMEAELDPRTGKPYAAQHIWDDVVKFNYDWDSPNINETEQYILDNILVPYVEEMAELGFKGIRLDSTPQTPHKIHRYTIQKFEEKLQEIAQRETTHYKKPIVLAETLADMDNAYEVKGLASHFYNSAYFAPNSQNVYVKDNQAVLEKNFQSLYSMEIFNDPDNWLDQQTGQAQGEVGGCALAPVSTHDEKRLWTHLKETFHNELEGLSPSEVTEQLVRLSRIKIAFSAFSTAGGYMITSGDEFLTDERANVFSGQIVTQEHFKILPKKARTLSVEEFNEMQESASKVRKNEVFTHSVRIPEYFIKTEAYPKSIADYKPDEAPETENVIVHLHEQEQMNELLDRTPEKKNLSNFIAQVNEVVRQRKTGYPDFYSKMHGTNHDRDIFCFIGRTAINHDVQDIMIVDVSGKKREEALDENIYLDFAKQTGVDVNYLKSTAYIVGDFPEKAKGVVLNG